MKSIGKANQSYKISSEKKNRNIKRTNVMYRPTVIDHLSVVVHSAFDSITPTHYFTASQMKNINRRHRFETALSIERV